MQEKENKYEEVQETKEMPSKRKRRKREEEEMVCSPECMKSGTSVCWQIGG